MAFAGCTFLGNLFTYKIIHSFLYNNYYFLVINTQSRFFLHFSHSTTLLPALSHTHTLSLLHMVVKTHQSLISLIKVTALRWMMSKCFYLCKVFSVELCFGNKGLPGTLSPGTGGFCLIPDDQNE